MLVDKAVPRRPKNAIEMQIAIALKKQWLN